MNSIFNLSSTYQMLMDELESIEEIDESFLKSLESINDSLENKILSYASIIKDLESKSRSINDAIKSMQQRVNKIINKSEFLKKILKEEMEKCNKNKIDNEYHEVSISLNNPKVKYLDESLIPDKYLRHKIKEITEPDTIEISKALKNGVSIPGAVLIIETRINIK